MTFADYIASHLSKPFQWGSNDCVSFVLNWVHIRSGVNHRATLPDWFDEASAVHAIAQVRGLRHQCDHLFNRVNPHLAIDGDIALIDRTVYLYSGPHIVAPGVSGLIFNDRMKAKCAWSYL
jgi:hypothetical protein